MLISTAKAEPAGVLVAVRDPVPGPGSSSLERVFEAFYTTKSDRLGHGPIDLPLDH